jgi:hypothetical protein
VKVLLENLPVHVEQARPAQLRQPGLRLLVDRMQLLERLDEKLAAAARRIDGVLPASLHESSRLIC